MAAIDLTESHARSHPTGRRPWIAFGSACLAWMFDAMDLTLFTLIMVPSLTDLVGSNDAGTMASIGGLIVAGKLLALGLAGIAFGVVADRVGRAKTMLITVLIYSAFTAASGLAQTWWHLLILQALAGAGLGGEWAAGVALVAETWPERTRPRALVAMQMCFAGGFFLAGLLNSLVGPHGWRWVFAAGALPAGIALILRWFVPEPEPWIVSRRQRLTSPEQGPPARAQNFTALFVPPLRARTAVGLSTAAAMMIGAWGTTTLLPIWIHQLIGPGEGALAVQVTARCFMLANAGAVLGYLSIMWMNDALGRRPTYALIAVGCLGTSLLVYSRLHTVGALMALMPLYGFFAIGGFGTFAVYLPELFPTRLRATGQGFCWNMGRVLTATGALGSGVLVDVLGSVPSAAAIASASYLIGLIAIWFGPETRGVPLPG